MQSIVPSPSREMHRPYIHKRIVSFIPVCGMMLCGIAASTIPTSVSFSAVSLDVCISSTGTSDSRVSVCAAESSGRFSSVTSVVSLSFSSVDRFMRLVVFV